MFLDRRISVLLIIIFILSLGLIVSSTPRTEAIYNSNSELYPNIVGELDKVSSININSKDKTLVFKRNNAGVWEIINNGHFPAQMNLINDLLLGVAYLKIIEQKTQDSKLYSLLQVDDVKNENSNAIAIVLKGSDDKILVNLLVGKRERQAIVGSIVEYIYVRKEGERQSWLVEGSLPLSLEFKDWVNQPLLPITAMDIRKIVISNKHNKTPVVIHKRRNGSGFYVQDVTNKSPKITALQQNNDLVHLLSNVEYHQVMAFTDLASNWRPTLKIEIDTIHDFNLKIELAKIKSQICARVITSFIGKDQDLSDAIHSVQMHKVNEFSELWVFKISEDIYNLVNKPQKDLINLLKR